ncbi:MAG: F0F1 ATP synthase subunit delta [Gammaproteobacteria bacterium]|nr:F0F1 ATP synthase subunit delta [Gammaproteobacteria bacterium]
MAEKRTLARPYANAIFQVALERKTLAEWSQALSALASAVSDDDVADILERPGLADEQAVALLTDLAGAIAPDVADTLAGSDGRNFLLLLAEYSRLNVLPEISVLFNEHKDLEENSVDVDVTSATELDESVRTAMTTALEQRLNRKVRLNLAVDAALIGGAILRAGDLVIDGSLKSRLGKLATSLIR